MESRLFVLCALCVAALQAQSISIVSPTTGQTLSGWTGSSFAVSLASAPSVATVCYTVDAQRAINPGPALVISGSSGALLSSGCSNAAPFSFPVNTFWWADSTQHQVVATAYDSLGNVVATSAPVSFSIANTWPVACGGAAPSFSVSTGTPVTSNWSGQVNLTWTMSGACASDSLTSNYYIDGVNQNGGSATTAGTATVPFDTTQFQNGPHNVAVVVTDGTEFSNYPGSGLPNAVQQAGEWSRTITFANGAAAMETRSSARQFFVAPNAAYSLTPTLVNTDGTTASSPTFDFVSLNTAVATVSTSRGSSTTVTGVAQGSTKILMMGEARTGTDATTCLGSLHCFTSSTMGGYPNYGNRLIQITGGVNCIVGLYYFKGNNGTTNTYLTVDPVTQNISNFTSAQGVSCSWATGPTRAAYALVNPTNAAIAHLSACGSVLTSYNPSGACKSIVLNEGFVSIGEISSQQYPVSFLQNVCNSGFNTLETGVYNIDVPSWPSSQSSFTSSLASYLSSQVSLLAASPCQLYLWLAGDSLIRGAPDLYAATQGIPSGRNGSTWTQSGIGIIFQSIKSSNQTSGNPPIIGMTLVDEWPYGFAPFQGPVTLGGATNVQNWLGSSSAITTAGSPTVCTANTGAAGPGATWTIFDGSAVISGSGTTGMNSAAGTLYPFTKISNSQFNFPCPNVASGLTLNSTNDPNLTVQVLSAGGWFTPPGGSSPSDYTPTDALAYFRSQIDSITGHIPVAPSIAGDSNAVEVACLNGGAGSYCGQSFTVNGDTVHAMGDGDDQYWTHSSAENYLVSNQSVNAMITDVPGAFDEELPQLLAYYGSYDPAKPMWTISQGTSINFGYFSAQPLTVVACTGNTITFSTPHQIANFIPGYTKLWITGSTDPNCNTNFYVLASPSPTTLTVAYAATKSMCTDTGAGSCGNHNGGTIMWPDGTTLSLYSIIADGHAGGVGGGVTLFNYGTNSFSSNLCGSGNNSVNRHRGQNFTVSGVTGAGATYFDGTTFNYDVENLGTATDSNGTSSACSNYFREMPVLAGTGGTANIVYDGSYVQGRNPGSVLTPGSSDPQTTYMSVVGAQLVGAAGHRLYQFAEKPDAYVPQFTGAPVNKGGWVQAAAALFNDFGDTELDQQLKSHPNDESGFSVPGFWAASTASHMWTRVQKYYLGATRVNSIDYGPLLESATYHSSSGYLHIVANFSNGPQTRTVILTPFETSGQNVILFVADAYAGIHPLTIITAGTGTYSLTLQAGWAAWFLFPTTFAGELSQPTLGFRLADIPNAASISARCAYDPYVLPNAIPQSLGAGSGGTVTTPLLMDRNVGPIYCKIAYLGSSNQVLAGGPPSAVLTY